MRQKTAVWATVAVLVAAMSAAAQDWETVSLIQHNAYQAVNGDGSSAYNGTFPIRLRGVLLNNPEDWLDPTAAYDPGYTPWFLGGEWEIFVQAVDMPDQTYDDGDLSGTACWMGQNYGNVPWHGDPIWSYTDAEWEAELERLNYPDGPGSDPIRKGDLLEIRVRGGLNYQGKMNVNEQHNNDPAYDFEIVRIQQGYGLPAPAVITLSDLKDASDEFIFDATRQTGGERHQASLVRILDVELVDGSGWGTDADLQLTDATGRTLDIHLGLSQSFNETTAPTGVVDVVGFLNQASLDGTDGYYLMVMNAGDVFTRGDANCDGVLNLFDIDPFVAALTYPDQYETTYPGCNILRCDTNLDGEANLFDIDPFVLLVCP